MEQTNIYEPYLSELIAGSCVVLAVLMVFLFLAVWILFRIDDHFALKNDLLYMERKITRENFEQLYPEEKAKREQGFIRRLTAKIRKILKREEMKK